MSEEWFDIYDDHQQLIGKAGRTEVHKKGYWHQTFHCWFYRIEDGRIFLLLQLRQSDKDLFADCLDISAAGHLASGETIEDGVREVEEELGVRVSMNDLQKIGSIPDSLEGSSFIDNEYAHVFAYNYTRLSRESIVIDSHEVADLYEIQLEDLTSLITKNKPCVIQSYYHLDKVLHVDKSYFVPHCERYYEQLLAFFKR